MWLSKEFIIITVLVVRAPSSVSWSASHGHCWLQGPFLSVFTLMTFPVYLKSEIFMFADDNVPLFAANVSFSPLKRHMWSSSLIIYSTSLLSAPLSWQNVVILFSCSQISYYFMHKLHCSRKVAYLLFLIRYKCFMSMEVISVGKGWGLLAPQYSRRSVLIWIPGPFGFSEWLYMCAHKHIQIC